MCVSKDSGPLRQIPTLANNITTNRFVVTGSLGSSGARAKHGHSSYARWELYYSCSSNGWLDDDAASNDDGATTSIPTSNKGGRS